MQEAPAGGATQPAGGSMRPVGSRQGIGAPGMGPTPWVAVGRKWETRSTIVRCDGTEWYLSEKPYTLYTSEEPPPPRRWGRVLGGRSTAVAPGDMQTTRTAFMEFGRLVMLVRPTYTAVGRLRRSATLAGPLSLSNERRGVFVMSRPSLRLQHGGASLVVEYAAAVEHDKTE